MLRTPHTGPHIKKDARDQAGRANRLSQRALWRAVAARDARLDGAFVYAVRSTGVYCRPTCPARRPGRGQVVFFIEAEAAEQAGFRPCRRCHPRLAPRYAESECLARACEFIEHAADGAIPMGEIAHKAGISRARLERTFRRLVGISPRSYAEAARMKRLKKRLREGDDVTTALYEAGFGSASRLYERSNRQLGMTPSTYRRGGQGMEISFTVASSAFGRVLVAGTVRGISAVYLGDHNATLEAELRREYPRATIRRNPAGVSRWVKVLLRHLAGRMQRLDLPLDVEVTAFQRRVWELLQRIPMGETRSYSEIARELGEPKATRAVGRACATNPVAVVVPCHRVLRRDGGLGGYRWGLARKQALLEREKSSSAKSR